MPLTSPLSSTSSATFTPDSWWLKDLYDGDLDVAVGIKAEVLNATIVEQQEIVQPLGEDRAVVIRGEILGHEFDKLVFVCPDQETYDAITALRARQTTLLLQSDMYEQWYIALGSDWEVALIPTQHRTTTPLREITTSAVEVPEPT